MGSTTKEYSKEIGGRTYTTKKLDAREGLDIMPRVIALLGPELMGLLFATDPKERAALMASAKVKGAAFASVAKTIATRGDEGAPPLHVFYDLLKKTSCNLVRMGDAEVPASVYTHFDSHFAGEYTHLFEVVMWVGEVNFTGPSADAP